MDLSRSPRRLSFTFIALSAIGCGTDVQLPADKPSTDQTKTELAPPAVVQVAPTGTTAPKPKTEEPKKLEVIKVKLPDNPLKAAYLLALYPNDELVRIERSEPVYLALLSRNGLERKWRTEAVDALAKLRKTSTVRELIAAIAYVDENDQVEEPKESEEEAATDFGEEKKDFTVLNELAVMLLASDAATLAKEREAIAELISNATNARARQIGFAAMISADAGTDKAWQHAEENAQGADLLAGLPLVSSGKLRASLFDKAKEQLEQAFEDQARDACLAALASMEGREADAFALIAAKFDDQLARPAAMNALVSVKNKDAWPKDQLAPLADKLIDFVKELPVEERNAPAGKVAVELAGELASRLPAADGKKIQDALGDLVVRRIDMVTVLEEMRYETNVIVVRAGRPVEVVLTNRDAMPHNVVFTKPPKPVEGGVFATLQKVGVAAELQVQEAAGMEVSFVPDLPEVLAATEMVPTRGSKSVTFTVPETPGVYPFVCTYTGHWLKMFGAMVVVEDVDSYLAKHNPLPEAGKLIGEPNSHKWTLKEVLELLPDTKSGRSFESGKQAFVASTCASCHRMQGQGGVIGPELTDVLKRYKPHEIAREIVTPDAFINEKYAAVQIVIAGKSYEGLVLEENDKEWKLHPLDKLGVECEPTIVSKADWDDEEDTIKKLTNSPMPSELTKYLDAEQFKDLLAYIIAGGDPKHPAFAKP